MGRELLVQDEQVDVIFSRWTLAHKGFIVKSVISAGRKQNCAIDGAGAVAKSMTTGNWDELAAIVEAYLAHWESNLPPDLISAVSSVPIELRSVAALELAKVDLEQRYSRGLRRLVEDYIELLPELRQTPLAELVLEEYHARKRAGERPSGNEYRRRFPDLMEHIEPLFCMDGETLNQATLIAIPDTVADIQVGQQIEDFDLLVRLGRGGFAQVFLARQRSMQRLVAVKISRDSGYEPQTLAQLDHENIVRVYDQLTLPDRGVRLLYMQYAAGGTLAEAIDFVREQPRDQWNGSLYLKAIDQILDARGESPPAGSALRDRISSMNWTELVCWIGNCLAKALESAHRQGVLHRDLKPSNVLLTAEGLPKLADFNISFSRNNHEATADTDFGGSLAYMAPEQLEAFDPDHSTTAADLDARSDLFSLGVLLWELLSGERPFSIDRSTLKRITPAIYSAKIEAGPDLTQVRKLDFQKTPGLEQLLALLLHNDPADRIQTASQLAREFRLCNQPDAKRLFTFHEQGWKSCCRKHPVIAAAIATLLPNAISAILNFQYNYSRIKAEIPQAEPTFMRIQAVINTIAFPTGVGLIACLIVLVSRSLHPSPGIEITPQFLASRRRLCLNLGNYASIVCVTLWMIAGPAYPISLRIIYGPVPTSIYLSFVTSLALCGLIAASYPFFGISFLSVRCTYPMLLQRDQQHPQESRWLETLSRQAWGYLVLAALMPMISVTILALSGSTDRRWLLISSISGIVGFAMNVYFFSALQRDLTTLIRYIKDQQTTL